MNLFELKSALGQMEELVISLPNGGAVPAHFHLTEVGRMDKSFVDCGGTFRQETWVSLQLHVAKDYDHRLKAGKFLNILAEAEQNLNLIGAHEIKVEIQGSMTKEDYELILSSTGFELVGTQTECLAPDACGIPEGELLAAEKAASGCTPGSGCC